MKILISSDDSGQLLLMPHSSTMHPKIEANLYLVTLPTCTKDTLERNRLKDTFSMLWVLAWVITIESMNCLKETHSDLFSQPPF